MSETLRQDYHALVRSDIIPLTPKTDGALLDVGGGIGATAARLKALGHARRAGVADLMAHHESNVDLDFRYSGSIEDPAFLGQVLQREGPFTIILCLDILEHLRDPWTIVRQLHGALAEDGVIVASIPNVRYFRVTIPLILRNEWTLTDSGLLDRTHLRFFVRKTAIELMTCSGLSLEEVRPRAGGGRRIHRFRRATLGLFDSFTDMQYLMRVRRKGPPI